MTGRDLVVLGYHRIGPPPAGGWDSWYFVAENAFCRHVEELRADGWVFIDADRLLSGLRDPLELPERSALMTFDDGYRSMVTHALPCLLRHEVPSVLFVPTDYVGGHNSFDLAEPQEQICGWDDLRMLERHGVRVESHGTSHRAFSDLDADERTVELARSKRVIEENLDKDVQLFAYAFGDVGSEQEQVEARLEELGYEAAFLYPLGAVRLPVENPYRLQRIAVGSDTDVAALAAECTGQQ